MSRSYGSQPGRAREVVLAHYPLATIRRQPETRETGCAAPIQTSRWAVYGDRGLGITPLGTGSTPEAAWHHAAKEVEKLNRRERTDRWVQYLLSRGFQCDPGDPN